MTYSRRTILRPGALVIVLFVASYAAGAHASNAMAHWEKFDFARQELKPAQIQALSLEDLKRLRGIVFGRHGRIFKERDIQSYLRRRPWYKRNPHFSNTALNATERKNLDTIRGAEARMHAKVEPGDLRFYQTRSFTLKRLGRHSLVDLHIMRAEVEAIHGKSFDDEPEVQRYFEERYWYQPDADYTPDRLSAIERKNLDVLASAEKKRRHLQLYMGDMRAFQNRRLTEPMLKGLGLRELRLLRNEVYAVRGQRFGPAWLQSYFSAQPWYERLPEDQQPTLSPIEIRNVATIVKRERAIHEGLATNPVSPQVLTGLFLEDARNLRTEIYARHGKVFKAKWLQDYFASLPWYKANPQFKDSSLNPIERRNVATIRAYEKRAQSQMAQEEG